MKKRDELLREDSCLNRSADDEPLFVLCGRDRFAAAAVIEWARRRIRAGVSKRTELRIIDALKVAREMEDYYLSLNPPPKQVPQEDAD